MSVRVVLDTNVTVSALTFQAGRLVWLRHAWMTGAFRPLVSRATTAELLRVLAYPKFRLETDDIAALLGDVLPFAETVDVGRAGTWPGLTDPDDAKFLDLAAAGKAAFMVTGDRHLQTVSPPAGCRTVPPAEFKAIIGATATPGFD